LRLEPSAKLPQPLHRLCAVVSRFCRLAPPTALRSEQLNFVDSVYIAAVNKPVTSVSVRSSFARQLLRLLEVPERAGAAVAGHDGSRRVGPLCVRLQTACIRGTMLQHSHSSAAALFGWRASVGFLRRYLRLKPPAKLPRPLRQLCVIAGRFCRLAPPTALRSEQLKPVRTAQSAIPPVQSTNWHGKTSAGLARSDEFDCETSERNASGVTGRRRTYTSKQYLAGIPFATKTPPH